MKKVEFKCSQAPMVIFSSLFQFMNAKGKLKTDKVFSKNHGLHPTILIQ